MNVGVPLEIKPDERRVALTPAGARELTRRGHRVLVEEGAGAGAGFPDAAYLAVGAECATVSEVFAEAELVLKVKEPLSVEVGRLSDQHTLFTYLHLAADPRLALALAETGARCIAYETVEDAQGRLPLLAPMSEVAGRLATQAGAAALTGPVGGPKKPPRRSTSIRTKSTASSSAPPLRADWISYVPALRFSPPIGQPSFHSKGSIASTLRALRFMSAS